MIEAIGRRAVVRTQLSFIAGSYSVPGPDVVIAPGRYEDYDDAHPRGAVLVVEVADSSLKQVVHDQVEVYSDPDRMARVHRSVTIAQRGERLTPIEFPDVSIRVDDLLPTPPA